MENNINELKPWGVYVFPWGTAIKHIKGEWTKLILSPSGQAIDVTGLNVILHDNGIEFTNHLTEGDSNE